MSTRRPVSGAFEAYRAEKEGARHRHPSRTRSTAPTQSPHGARAVDAIALRIRALVAGPGSITAGPSPAVVRRRLTGLRAVAVVALVVVVAKLVSIQVLSPERYVATGVEQRLASAPLNAGRGTILDRNGVALALSVPRRTVFADPALIEDPEAVARRLAPLLDLAVADLERDLTRPGRFVVLAHTVDDPIADEVEDLGLDGIATFEELERIHPADDLARSLLGSVAVDGSKGISGIEAQYDEMLTGTPGRVTYERSFASGGGAITGTRSSTEPRAGAEITLTLDQTLQFEAERSLAEHLGRAGARGGTAIVTRPSTGEILALANLVEEEDGGGYRPGANNAALTTVFEPGSVNKILTVAAAIEEGVVEPDTVLDVPDHIDVGDHTFTDVHPHATTEWTVTDILASSSNVGTIMLAQMVGGERLDGYLRRFGFGTLTGLGFPAESPGIMLPTDQWAQQSTAIGSIPIGQGVAVTAVQMVQALNTLANDGELVAPRLVRSVDGRPVPAPVEARRVVSPETARAVRAMMAEVVSRGTGQAAQVPGYRVAGKTGTARKPQPAGGYTDENGAMQYVATFVGMLPSENPDLSIIVVVDEPDPGRSYYAADVAAPAFADLARIALRHLQIPPSAGGDVADIPTLSDSAAAVEDSRVLGRPRDEAADDADADDADDTGGSGGTDNTDGAGGTGAAGNGSSAGDP